MTSPNQKPRRVLAAVLLATVAIFGALVAGLTVRLRGELRDEVLRREAEAVHAVALMQLSMAETRVGGLDAVQGLEEAFAAVLESSRLRGVFAVHVFDRAGELYAALPIMPGENAAPRWWREGLTRPTARFHKSAALERALGIGVEEGSVPTRAPLLDIAVPLRTPAGAELGVARYWSDGAAVAQEFARMDRRLAVQAGLAFVGGTLLVTVILFWAFRKVGEAQQRLLEQKADLARANEELDFAAKTGALGAISAHLIHELKNPLAGLEGFVADNANATPDAVRGDAWASALETTRRLRAMITEVTTVLREESGEGSGHAVPAREVVEEARIRAASQAEHAEVAIKTEADSDSVITGRSANLAGLVLANLLTNAIEAAPRRSTIHVEARGRDGGVEFLVRDQGPGLPSSVHSALFRPVRSTKRGGGGVGLAISHRLARHAGGELTLVRSDQAGTVFRLRVPALSVPVNALSTSRA